MCNKCLLNDVLKSNVRQMRVETQLIYQNKCLNSWWNTSLLY